MTEGWMLDEPAHAGPEHLDPESVAAYDRKQAFDPSDDVAALCALGIGASSSLIDLGAGTGKLALAAASVVGQVTAVDVSPAMVSLFRARVADARLSNVESIQGGFLTYSHAGPPADAIYTRNALHHLPDFWKGIALERIAGMLAPGGVLMVRDLIYDFEPTDADAVFARWLDGAVDDPSRGYTREDFEVHIRTEHSTFRWLFEPMLSAAGFEIIAVDYRQSIYASYSCVKRSS